MKNKEVAEIIAELEGPLGLTKEHIAAFVGVDGRTVIRWREGGTPISLARRRLDILLQRERRKHETKLAASDPD